MFAIARFNISLAEATVFEISISQALSALSSCPGFLDGEYGRNLDDSMLWSLITQWENVGSYRRALSNTMVKMQAIPLLAQAIDEPGAYEGPYTE